MIRFEKKAPPRQASDPGSDPLSRFFDHGIRGIHGKGAQIFGGSSFRVVGVFSSRSHLSP